MIAVKVRYVITRQQIDDSQIMFGLFVKNDDEQQPERVTLKAIIGPSDAPRPVLTTMLSHED